MQKLADSGMPLTEMIKFTGHSSVESLISYLDDGILDPNVIRGVAQGAVLFGAGSVYTADFAPLAQAQYDNRMSRAASP